MEPLSDQCTESYLEFLKVGKPMTPTLDYLDRLIKGQLERVTFENVDMLLKRCISLDAEAIFEKVTRRGRGGCCFELNSFFGRLLLALGYSLLLRAARLRLTTPDDSAKRTRLSHMVLLVELNDGDHYIVDVGMAQCGLHRALPVAGDATPFRIRTLDDLDRFEVAVPTSDGGWKAFYIIEPYDLDWLDFCTLHWYSTSNPHCATQQLLLVGRRSPRGDGCWLRLMNDRFVRWSSTGGVVEKRLMNDENEIIDILRDEFGLNLSREDDEAPLRLRLREVLDNFRLEQKLFPKKLLWPEG
ncbi:arylamine N-acetyltransferase [Rhipicephalus microplus]|uniref:arylamine N-acetyltransferase n=1 Tax=Rhipicephalus microplus TaxID=6941 RepID=UPI003F6AB233